MLRIERIKKGQGETYEKLRLTSLLQCPEAYLTKYSDAVKRTKDSWKDQADSAAQGSDQAIFFAYHGNEPIGLLSLYRASDGSSGEIVQLWVSPDQRESGVASSMIEKVVEWCQNHAFDRVFTEVMQHNTKAGKTFISCKFRVVAKTDKEQSKVITLERSILKV